MMNRHRMSMSKDEMDEFLRNLEQVIACSCKSKHVAFMHKIHELVRFEEQ